MIVKQTIVTMSKVTEMFCNAVNDKTPHGKEI